MAYIVADRVKETTTVTGTGPATLAGAASGYRSFASQLSIGDTCAYVIVNSNASEWETGIGTYSAVNTLTRTTIQASTNANAAVVFSAGTKDVFMGPTADSLVDYNPVTGAISNATWNGSTISTSKGGTGLTTLGTANQALSVNSAGTALEYHTVVGSVASADGSVIVSQTGQAVDLSVAVAAAATNVVVQVRNDTGATLTKGTVVYINNAIGQLPTVAKALATSDNTSAQTLGMMSADLNNNSNGFVTIIGLITGLNTQAYNDGDQLYLSDSVAGTFTNVKPLAPSHLVYVGIVEYKNPSNGKIFVKIQNGYELDELHDVSAQSPSNGQTIVYNSSNQLWEKNYPSLTNALSSVPVVSGAGNNLTFTAGSGVTSGAGGSLILQAGRQATTGGDGKVVVKQVAGQTSNLQEWQNSSGTALALVDSAGTISAGALVLTTTNNVGSSLRFGSGSLSIGWYSGDYFGLNNSEMVLGTVTNSSFSNSSVAVRNSTAPQNFRVYNTFTNSTNYERLGITWASNICTISPENAGAGSARALTLATPSLGTTGTVPALSLVAGNGTVTGAKGGSINITAGNGGSGNGGGGGSVTIAAGVNVADNVQPPGNITITAGATGGASVGGSVTIQGGTSSTGGAPAGGTVNILGGAQGSPGNVSTTSGTGSVVVKSPDSNALMGSAATSLANPTGNVSIATGNGGTISTLSTQPTIRTGSSGTISISTGTGGNATVVGTTRNAGSSGTITISTSSGGNASGGTTNNGGSSGSIIIATGVAGTGSTANGTVGTIQFNVGGINTANVLSTGLGSNAVTAIPLPTTATVTAATGNGTTVTYTAANTFSVGQVVSITGLTTTTGSSLNLSNQTITTASATQFTITNATVGTAAATQAGTATIQSAGNSVTITAGNGSGVGAGGSIILQPGAQGSSGGNGWVKFYDVTGANTRMGAWNNSTQGYGFGWDTQNNGTLGTGLVSSSVNGTGYIGVKSQTANHFMIETNNGTTALLTNSANTQSRLIFVNGNNAQTTSGSAGICSYTTGVITIRDGGTSIAGGSLSFPSTTTAFSANTNDLALTASAFQRINCTSAASLTGIAPPSGGTHVDGRMVRVYNVGTANLTLAHNSASSTAANRFWNSTGADIVLSTHQYVELIYDSTDNGRGGAGWRVSSVH